MNKSNKTGKKSLPKQVPHILAPAGGREQFFAALKSGADAVYLGLKNFNARARAENFTLDDMRELIPLANSYKMQVLITLNTLIKESELKLVIREIHELYDLGVHAFIVQDVAVLKLLREIAPHIRIHASTQMAVHNLSGVLQIAEMGAKRIVLARETTIDEMKKIYTATREYELELEAFCHGSLCYSYSGLCLFSGAKDARSANRGECAYTCRHPYKILSEPGHGFLFSMKDLNTINNIKDLTLAGIHTLKIEGRKKDAMYVATSIRMYRRALDKLYGKNTLRYTAPNEANREFRYEEDNIWPSLSFQRKPTNFFLSGRYRENGIDLDNPTHIGIKAGTINEINGRKIKFKTKVRLEKYDGLRIDSAERLHHSKVRHGEELTGNRDGLKDRFNNNEANFSLRQMKVNGKNKPVANINDIVTITLPQDIELPKVGDTVYQVRSSELKAEIAKLTNPPANSRLRPLQPIDAEFIGSSNGDMFTLQGRLLTQNKTITESHISIASELAKNTNLLTNGLNKQFKILGQSGFIIKKITVTGETQYFVPASMIKELKKKLEENLEKRYNDAITKLVQNSINKHLNHTTLPIAKTSKEDSKYIIKFDQIRYVESFQQFYKNNKNFNIIEFIFEPKRAYLERLNSEETLSKLKKMADETGAILRFSLPIVTRSWDEPFLNKWLKLLIDKGYTHFELGNLGSFTDLKKHISLSKLSLSADFTLYTMNNIATDVWNKLGINNVTFNIEDDFTNIKHMVLNKHNKNITYRAIVYKDTPLFIAEACSLTALHDGCPGSNTCGYRTLVIENEQGEKFHVAHENCKSIVYGEEPYSISANIEKLRNIGIDEFRIDFLTRPYELKQIDQVLTAVISEKQLRYTHSANFNGQLK